MHRLSILCTVLWLFITMLVAADDAQSAGLRRNITAIGARHGVSTLECWQLSTPFAVSSVPGSVGSAVTQLGDVANITLVVQPAMFDGGPHNAARNQYVIFTTGLAVITVPNNPDAGTAYISGGEFGLIFASDTAAVSKIGHRTQYPGVTETVAMQMPAKDGKIPAHSVLHYGPCFANETLGLRSLAIART